MKGNHRNKKISKSEKEGKKSEKKPAKPYVPKHLNFDNETKVRKMEFEKIILQNPNSSEAWIRLIAFTTEHESLEVARQEVERSLEVVNFRNDNERLNLWKAYINLEYYYGDITSLQDVGRRAMNACDRQKIISHMVMLYTKDHKFEEAEELLKILLKKSENKFAAWLSYAELLLDWANAGILNCDKDEKEDIQKQFEERVKELIRRALQSLDRRMHVNFLTQYGVLEYRHRNFLNARTTFENLISNFPKKNNIW